MNRRDLFRGAGALALTAAMPTEAVAALPPADDTPIWLVSYGPGA